MQVRHCGPPGIVLGVRARVGVGVRVVDGKKRVVGG
jgi:hypothetical protein